MAASGSVGVMAPQQEQQRQQDPESLMPMSDDASRSAILCKTIGRRRMIVVLRPDDLSPFARRALRP